MNKTQIDRLHQLGLIGDVQHTAALAQLRTSHDVMPRLNVRAPLAGRLAVDESARTITGTASVYGELIPSHYMYLEAGSLNSRQPLNKNKMLVDHDPAQPIGYLSALDEGTLEVTYTIPEGDAGDAALASAQAGLRDGLSVGFTATDYFFDEDYNIHVTAADWYETSLVAIPAVASAGVTSVAASVAPATHHQEVNTVNREQLAAALAAGTITQEQHDHALAVIGTLTTGATIDPVAPAAPSPQTAALSAGPTIEPRPQGQATVRERGHSFGAMVADLSQRAQRGEFAHRSQLEEVQAFALAIGTYTTPSDAGEAWLQPEWLGEVFTATNERRDWIDAWGTPGNLVNLKAKGWRWDVEPDVEDYDGDLATVNGNNPTTEGDDWTGWPVASAHRVARSFVDFSDPEFTASFIQARARQYQIKSNAGVRTATLAAATTLAGGSALVAADTVVDVLKKVVRAPRAFGGKINRVFLDDTLFEELEDLPTGIDATLPLWLKNANIVMNLADGTASSDAGLTITNDSTLAAGQVAAFDNRAGSVKEKAPIQLEVQAVSVGGIDLGFFGYLRFDDYDPRLIVKGTRPAGA